MADVDANGITFGDNFVSVDEVGEVDGWVFLEEFKFIFFEPFVRIFWESIDLLGVGDTTVFQEQAASL